MNRVEFIKNWTKQKENRYVNCIEYYRCLREELLSSKGKSRR